MDSEMIFVAICWISSPHDVCDAHRRSAVTVVPSATVVGACFIGVGDDASPGLSGKLVYIAKHSADVAYDDKM